MVNTTPSVIDSETIVRQVEHVAGVSIRILCPLRQLPSGLQSRNPRIRRNSLLSAFWLGRDSSSNRRDRTGEWQAVPYNRASNVYRDVYGFESPRIGVALLSSYWRSLQPEHLARTSVGWCIGTCSFRTVLCRPVTWGDSGGRHLAFIDFCATIRQVSRFI